MTDCIEPTAEEIRALLIEARGVCNLAALGIEETIDGRPLREFARHTRSLIDGVLHRAYGSAPQAEGGGD